MNMFAVAMPCCCNGHLPCHISQETNIRATLTQTEIVSIYMKVFATLKHFLLVTGTCFEVLHWRMKVLGISKKKFADAPLCEGWPADQQGAIEEVHETNTRL